MPVKRSAALGFIFITILVDVIGLGVIIPIVPKLIQKLTGEGISEASRYGGWLIFSFAIMQFIFSPILGSLSDRYGRRPVLLLSLLGLGLDYILQAFAPTIAWLFVGRLIAGVMGASFTTATAYIADISTPEKRAQNFGLVGAAFGLGFIIGPVIGGLASKWGTSVPFMIAAALTLMNVLYGYFILPESLTQENRRAFDWSKANPLGALKHLQKYPVVSGLIVTLVLVNIAAHAVQSNWTYYTIYKFNWSEETIGFSLAVVGLLVSLVQGLLIRKAIPLLGQRKAIYIGLGFYAVGLVLFGIAWQGWMMFAFLVPYCLGGIAGPTLQGIISNQVPANEQGELQGALTSLVSMTSILGPLIMNNLFAYSTGKNSLFYLPGAAFFLAAALVMIGLLLCVKTLSAQQFAAKSL